MGSKAYSTFQDDLKFELGNNTAVTDYVGNWINEAYMTLTTMMWARDATGKNRRVYFPELGDVSPKTTSTGVEYVEMPDDLYVFEGAWDATNDKKLVSVDWRAYVTETGRSATSSRGEPDKCVRRGTRLYIYPTPDDSYQVNIYYRKRPTALSAVTDVTAIGAEWDYPILKLAVLQSLLRLNDYESYAIEKKAYDELVSAVVGVYDEEAYDKQDAWEPDFAYHDRRGY